MLSGQDPEEVAWDQGAEIGEEDMAGEGIGFMQGHRTWGGLECGEQHQMWPLAGHNTEGEERV